MCSAFTANGYSWFEHRSACGRYYGNVAFPGTEGDFQKDCIFKGWICDTLAAPATLSPFLMTWHSEDFFIDIKIAIVFDVLNILM